MNDNLVDLLKSIQERRKKYLILLSELPENKSIMEEFLENFKDDVDYIRKIRHEEMCVGVIGKACNEFEDFLISLPNQFYAMNELRKENEETK